MATYSYLGSEVWTFGSVYATGSINVTNLYGGSEVFNRVAGSIVNMPIVGVSGIAFNTVWTGVGSVTGQVNIGAGSIQTYSPLGSTFVVGSVYVTGSINIATTILPISGIVNVGLGSISINNFSALGSNIVIKNDLTLFQQPINISSGTMLKVISGNVGSTINVWGYEIVASAATTLQWLNGSPGSALLGPQQFSANGGVVATVQPPYWLAQCYPGSDVWISLTAGSLGGRVNYYLT